MLLNMSQEAVFLIQSGGKAVELLGTLGAFGATLATAKRVGYKGTGGTPVLRLDTVAASSEGVHGLLRAIATLAGVTLNGTVAR